MGKAVFVGGSVMGGDFVCNVFQLLCNIDYWFEKYWCSSYKKKQSQIVYSSRLEPFVAFLQNAIDSDITPHSKLE